MINSKLFRSIGNPDSQQVLQSAYRYCCGILDSTCRFKLFTLHGKNHIDNIFRIVDMLIDGGVEIGGHDAFLLGLSICVHDIGMVAPLKEMEIESILGVRGQAIDPVAIEPRIRELHHELSATHINKRIDYFTSIGLTPNDIFFIKEISKMHRVVKIDEYKGKVRCLGALLRIADELDIYANRAPISTLRNEFTTMDTNSCWHWFKHNITIEWEVNENVFYIQDGNGKRIVFKLGVRPPKDSSIKYWLRHTSRPILKALQDENAARVIDECWNVKIEMSRSVELSAPHDMGEDWERIESYALTSHRKSIIVIDDEVRKFQDVFLPLTEYYHVVYAPTVEDAIEKIKATQYDLAIVDMQIGANNVWSPEETADYKKTGFLLCSEINRISPNTKIGIFTGSRHSTDAELEASSANFVIRKPIDTNDLLEVVNEHIG